MGTSTLRLLSVGCAFALASRACVAHGLGGAPPSHGGFDVGLACVIVGVAVLYAFGVARIWARAGRGRGIRVADAGRFALAMVVVAVALLSPLDALADRSFALHMVEHELLMVLAAPLFALARPLEACVWALPHAVRRAAARPLRAPALALLRRETTRPLTATGAHAIVLWTWHLPTLFVAALASLPLHILQHACFFVSALAFWWAVVGGAARKAGPVSLACLFATMLQTSALGALLTLAPMRLYGGVTARGSVFGLTPLEDQQLGGLVMWVPGALAYVIVALAIVATWLARPSQPPGRAAIANVAAS